MNEGMDKKKAKQRNGMEEDGKVKKEKEKQQSRLQCHPSPPLQKQPPFNFHRLASVASVSLPTRTCFFGKLSRGPPPPSPPPSLPVGYIKTHPEKCVRAVSDEHSG
jgi:hypothetical protein